MLNRPGLDEIITVVERIVSEQVLAKKVGIYLCHRYSGARLREIGERYGLSDAAITQASRRMKVACEHDETVRKLVAEVEEGLNVRS